LEVDMLKAETLLGVQEKMSGLAWEAGPMPVFAYGQRPVAEEEVFGYLRCA
jgi:hypothetical protein